MKKVLSLVLAALMLLSCMSISVFAEDATTSSPYFGQNGASESQAVLKFKLGGGTCKSGQYVYDTQNHVSVYTAPEDIGDTFVLVPTASDMYTLNSAVTLPSVKGPKGYNFVGWQRASGTEGTADRRIYSSAPGQYIVSSDDIGKVVEFVAVYEQGEGHLCKGVRDSDQDLRYHHRPHRLQRQHPEGPGFHEQDLLEPCVS